MLLKHQRLAAASSFAELQRERCLGVAAAPCAAEQPLGSPSAAQQSWTPRKPTARTWTLSRGTDRQRRRPCHNVPDQAGNQRERGALSGPGVSIGSRRVRAGQAVARSPSLVKRCSRPWTTARSGRPADWVNGEPAQGAQAEHSGDTRCHAAYSWIGRAWPLVRKSLTRTDADGARPLRIRCSPAATSHRSPSSQTT